jgi:hypothetical protein
LVTGLVWLLRRRPTWQGFLFLISALLMLIAQVTISGSAGALIDSAAGGAAQMVVDAGVRGLLLGIALGVLVVAVRFISGTERPYER